MTDEGVRPPFVTDEGVRAPLYWHDARTMLLREPVPVYMRGGRLPEEQVVSLWLEATAARSSFACTRGEAVTIVSPGVRNRFEGPDFLDARLIIDGVERRGDIEIHTREEDWRAHGHHRDPRYGTVVLHVVLYAGRAAAGAPPHIPVVELCTQLGRPMRAVWSDAPSRSVPACRTRAHLVPSRVAAAAVALASARRFAAKVDRAASRMQALHSLLDAGAACRQVLYEHLVRALGYGGNEDAALALARIVPLARLAREGGTAQLDAEAARAFWHRAGVRPGNAMHLRLAWLAAVAHRLDDPTWHARLQRAVVRDAHAARSDEVPQLFAPPEAVRMLHPGPERIAEILTNAVAPVTAAWARQTGDVVLAQAAAVLYAERRPAPANAITRRLGPVLGISTPMRTGEQQGLLAIWNDLCTAGRCGECLVGAWLAARGGTEP
jgi:hypothetical protein